MKYTPQTFIKNYQQQNNKYNSTNIAKDVAAYPYFKLIELCVQVIYKKFYIDVINNPQLHKKAKSCKYKTSFEINDVDEILKFDYVKKLK